ncbi:unnamed protein product [Rotaria sp. Silwood2]|nr:unnamed protein product [Rotaria sp. Silwood2]CAF4650973.1 unnamed protein product [Rotaria sp. Silwood2]
MNVINEEKQQILNDNQREKFLVERIITHRFRNDKKEYLIAWQGYPEEQNTWESQQNLDCPNLTEEYEKRLLSTFRFMINDSSSSSSSSFKPIANNKFPLFDVHHEINHNDQPSLLSLLRQHVVIFSGDPNENARQWFRQIDTKFTELNVSLDDRLDIIEYFLACDALIWYSTNQDKFKCYTDFCRLTKNKCSSLNSPCVNNPTFIDASSDCLIAPSAPAVYYNKSLQDINSNCVFNSALSTAISKALIDKFIKDPIKCHGAKDNVLEWIDELEQQFKTIQLCDSDKLNLIHIYLKGEAYQWFQQHQTQLTSWSIFITEITKSFTSNLQRDLAF